MKPIPKATVGAILILFSFVAAESRAQTSSSTAAPGMWGTVPGGVSVLGAIDSAISHAQNGIVASQVNAARAGILLGTNTTIQTIGSQTIMQNNITGNNNSASTSGSQTSSNSGSTTNNGSVNR